MSIQTKEIKRSTIMWTRESTLKAFQNKRELTPEEVKNGARKLFTVKGDGTIMDVRDGSGQFVMSADGSGERVQPRAEIVNRIRGPLAFLAGENLRDYFGDRALGQSLRTMLGGVFHCGNDFVIAENLKRLRDDGSGEFQG